MKLRLTRAGMWWRCTKIDWGQISSYSFVWPLVITWIGNTMHDRLEHKRKEKNRWS